MKQHGTTSFCPFEIGCNSHTNMSSLSSEVQWEDFEYALSRQRPSQQMQVESDLPKRSWSALGG